MDDIPISSFADIAGISMSTLRSYTKPYKEALQFLRQQGYSYNYEVVLFLCYVLVYDVRKFYPNEDVDVLKVEQRKIVNKVNENLNRRY